MTDPNVIQAHITTPGFAAYYHEEHVSYALRTTAPVKDSRGLTVAMEGLHLGHYAEPSAVAAAIGSLPDLLDATLLYIERRAWPEEHSDGAATETFEKILDSFRDNPDLLRGLALCAREMLRLQTANDARTRNAR